MLLRFSRLAFWLAAAVAALALLAPHGHETLLTGVAGLTSVLALILWRAALGGEARRPLARRVDAPAAPVFDAAVLAEAAALLLARAHAAGSFEAALHAVAQVLRGELGARDACVHEVLAVDDAHAQISDLIESQPGFRTVARRIRLDATPLARALRSRVEAGTPPGALAVPVTRDAQVVAVIVLSTLDLTLEPNALAGLLALARVTLSERAAEPTAPDAAAPAQMLVAEDNAVQPDRSCRLLRPMGCRATVASGMLPGSNLLSRTQFGLVPIDMQMAGMDAADELRGFCHDPGGARRFIPASDTPMIALSAPGSLGDGERVRELGFDDHLFKPITQSEARPVLSKHQHPLAPAVSTDAAPQARVDASSAPEPGRLAVLDAAALARLAELDPTGASRLVERVLQAFQTSAARLRQQFDAARRSDDRAAIRMVVHTLKSSSASIGALDLSQLCAQVETAIRLDAHTDLATPLEALDAALDRALQAIGALQKERA